MKSTNGLWISDYTCTHNIRINMSFLRLSQHQKIQKATKEIKWPWEWENM